MHSKQDSDIQTEICKLLNKGVIIPTEKEMIFFQTFLQGRKEMTHPG